MALRFGLYAELQTPPDKPHPEVYAELLGQALSPPTWRTFQDGLEVRGWRRRWLARRL